MATETLTEPTTVTTVIPYPIADNAIAEMRTEYMPLVVTDLKDAKQLAVVRAARLAVASHRIAVEKKRKELKEDSLEWGRKVDTEAKRLTALLNPIEQHLIAQESKVAEEKARIEREAAEALRVKIQARVEALLAAGHPVSYEAAGAMSDAVYQEGLATATEAQRVKREQEAERLRLQAEEIAKQKAEAERLAAERAELDRQRQAQKAEADRLAAEQKKIDDAKAIQEREARESERAAEIEAEKKRRAADLEKVRLEAAEQSRIATEQRLKREAQEAKELQAMSVARAKSKAEAAEKKRLRLEALRPDKEKLLAFAEALDNMPRPVLLEASEETSGDVAVIMENAATSIRELANNL
jgi:hypothetical protein